MLKELTNEAMLTAIVNERTTQVEQWGGNDHDDHHNMQEWSRYVMKQLDRARYEPYSPESEERVIRTFTIANAQEFEERMVKVAALAMAAAQSTRRRRIAHFDA